MSEAPMHLQVRYGPDAPPLAEQLGLDPEHSYCRTAQMLLDGVTESLAQDRTTSHKARERRQLITERLVRYYRQGRLLEGRDEPQGGTQCMTVTTG